MDQQEELMINLLEFYKRRYGSDFESKFNSSCEDLVSLGDITKTAYLSFCLKNNVEPNVNFRKEPPRYTSHC